MTPAELDQLRELINDGVRSQQIAETMGKGRKTILAVVKREGLVWKSRGFNTPEKTKRPPPDDFRERAAEFTAFKLIFHYRTSWDVVMRWFAETGADRYRVPSGPKPKPKPPRKPKASAGSLSRMGHTTAPIVVEHVRRDTTSAGQAADFLRRLGPVSRCNEAGRADIAGRFWRRGSRNGVMTDAELVDLAVSLGWRAFGVAA